MSSSMQQDGVATTTTTSSRSNRFESFDVAEALLGEATDGLLSSSNTTATSTTASTRPRTRSIPVPQSQQQQQQQQQGAGDYYPATASAASSQGSSGSAFLSQVLNTNQHSNANTTTTATTTLSHTPPTQLGTSYENAHFGKRPRSGSVSGRLRSASEYLEEKGLLDRQTKGILKDLIIIGDEELQQALDHYEAGDPSRLELMIQSGALQNRLPQDLDILGDLDLDFLTMDDEDMGMSHLGGGGGVGVGAIQHQDIEALPDQQQQPDGHDDGYDATDEQVAGALHALAHPPPHLQQPPAKTITPSEDIGMVGDLEFAGEFVSDHGGGGDHYGTASRLPSQQLQQQQHYASKGDAASTGESPPDSEPMSEYEKRLRSNSLFSALLDRPAPSNYNPQQNNSNNNRSGNTNNNAGGAAPTGDSQYGQWMERYPPAGSSAAAANNKSKTTTTNNTNRPGGIQIGKPRGRPKTGTGTSRNKGGLAASLEADRKRREREEKKRERQEKKEKKLQEKKAAAAAAAAAMEEEEEEQHVPGSGRPRNLDDPNLKYSLDEHGLQQCQRPEGWIGAYSPDSRAVRIERFLQKRHHRVWTKTVKYDVRKNFADSRLRVKGRFVKKEDELMMRELMSLT